VKTFVQKCYVSARLSACMYAFMCACVCLWFAFTRYTRRKLPSSNARLHTGAGSGNCHDLTCAADSLGIVCLYESAVVMLCYDMKLAG
jgi:hypothetical protein